MAVARFWIQFFGVIISHGSEAIQNPGTRSTASYIVVGLANSPFSLCKKKLQKSLKPRPFSVILRV